jgi:hypothetical protein
MTIIGSLVEDVVLGERLEIRSGEKDDDRED